jgi:hypothetical protein
MIKAKPVVKNKFWILRDGNRKVGEVNAIQGGFSVTVENREARFKTLATLKRRAGIEFDDSVNIVTAKKKQTDVHGFAAAGPIFNDVWDVQMKLPLYTKKSKSRSFYAAGWYKMKMNNRWKTVYCPKLIILQRNEYQGPFKQNPDLDQFNQLFSNDSHQ